MEDKDMFRALEDAREARDSAALWLAFAVTHAHSNARTAGARLLLHESRVRFMDAQDAYSRALDVYMAAQSLRTT